MNTVSLLLLLCTASCCIWQGLPQCTETWERNGSPCSEFAAPLKSLVERLYDRSRYYLEMWSQRLNTPPNSPPSSNPSRAVQRTPPSGYASWHHEQTLLSESSALPAAAAVAEQLSPRDLLTSRSSNSFATSPRLTTVSTRTGSYTPHQYAPRPLALGYI